MISESIFQSVNCFPVYMKYGTRNLDKYIKTENVAGKSYVFITGINIYPMYIFLYETFKKYILNIISQY